MVVIVFGCSYSKHQDKYCSTKLLPLLPFSLLPTIKSLLCHSFSFTASSPPLEDGKKRQFVYVGAEKQFRKKLETKTRIFSFLWCRSAAMEESAAWRKYFSPMVFIVKRQWTNFSETQKMCGERGKWLDLPRHASFLLSFFLFFPIVAHRRSFKWHLTVLLTADMANSG